MCGIRPICVICFRDLQQFKKLKLEGEVALEIIKAASTLDEPSLPHLARAVGVVARRVQTYLLALEELFVLQRINPYIKGRGKAIFLPLDASVAHHYCAPLRRRIQILLMNECLCRSHYAGTGSIQLFYHRTRGYQRLDLLESHSENKTYAYQIIENESFSGLDFELMKAFQKQNPTIKCRILAPVDESTAIGQISLEPWETIL